MAPSELPILVTCGLPYANGPCHIGHLRTYVPADIYVRGLKKMGKKPIFICGSVSHGTPIVVNAEEKFGVTIPDEEVKNLKTGECSDTGLPTSNVLYFELDNDSWCCARPSGTEPKIKFYMGIKGTSLQDAETKLQALKKAVTALI